MADPMRDSSEEMIDEPRPSPKASKSTGGSPKAKKKSRGRGCAMFLLSLLLLGGTLSGLHLAGVWDARTVLYPLLPQIPLVGEQLSDAFGVPPRYALTVAERRALEIEEREQLLAIREAELNALRTAAEAISADLLARAEALGRQEALLAEQSAQQPTQDGPDAEEKNIEDLLRTYQEMSPRNAAQIMQDLREDLAVTLLSRMPQDQAAAILAKMDSPKAARLTERLATLKR
jgi:flagellar motility protein MotE (MotC chaperone)